MTRNTPEQKQEWIGGQEKAIQQMKRDLFDLQEKFMEKNDLGALEIFMELCVQKNKELMEKYGERAKMNMWRHALIGSSVRPEDQTEEGYEDLPGEDSVQFFVQRLNERFSILAGRIAEARNLYAAVMAS